MVVFTNVAMYEMLTRDREDSVTFAFPKIQGSGGYGLKQLIEINGNQTSIHGFVPITFFTGGTEMTQVMTITAPHCLRTKSVDLRKILKGKRDG